MLSADVVVTLPKLDAASASRYAASAITTPPIRCHADDIDALLPREPPSAAARSAATMPPPAAAAITPPPLSRHYEAAAITRDGHRCRHYRRR